MDGTALYQAVAAVFIAQTLGMDLTLGAQLTIVLTAVLASIGTAAVPGVGIIMLVIILEAIGVPTAGIALILGVDRILDMLRTVTNVTGDATVATVIAVSRIWVRPRIGSGRGRRRKGNGRGEGTLCVVRRAWGCRLVILRDRVGNGLRSRLSNRKGLGVLQPRGAWPPPTTLPEKPPHLTAFPG